MPRGTQEPLKRELHFQIRGCHPLWPTFPSRSLNTFLSLVKSGNLPDQVDPERSDPADCLIFVVLQPRTLVANRPVWAVPHSLAATNGITVVFSS